MTLQQPFRGSSPYSAIQAMAGRLSHLTTTPVTESGTTQVPVAQLKFLAAELAAAKKARKDRKDREAHKVQRVKQGILVNKEYKESQE